MVRRRWAHGNRRKARSPRRRSGADNAGSDGVGVLGVRGGPGRAAAWRHVGLLVRAQGTAAGKTEKSARNPDDRNEQAHAGERERDEHGRVPIVIEPNSHNARYIQTKREKLGHLLDK